LSADDIASLLKEALKEQKISAFVDTIDIPKDYELTSKWWQFRDDAIKNCNLFLMLITAGFDRSEEIAKEIQIARENGKKFVVFRWSKLSPKIEIKLGNEKLSLEDFNQISFDSPGMLIRQFFDNCSLEKKREKFFRI
jgi:hypothetical protein